MTIDTATADLLISSCDVGIFAIETMTSKNDRLTLLKIQNIIRSRYRNYAYLEVGSHVGGSLLPHLVDPCCRKVFSIDPRPASQPDERGRRYDCIGNATQRMIDILTAVTRASELQKLQTFDKHAMEITVDDLGSGIRLAFIDAEHTNQAVFRDFLSIYPLLEKDAIIVFHDSCLLFDALANITALMQFMRIRYRTMYLPDSIFILAFNELADEPTDMLAAIALDSAAFIEASRRALYKEIIENAPYREAEQSPAVSF